MQLKVKMKSALTVVLFRLFTIGVFVDGEETGDVKLQSVMEGDSVTLKSGVTDIQTVNGIEWRFDGSRLAKISSSSVEIFDEPDMPFKDRLQLDNQTGDVKISNIRTTDSGQYKVKIKSTRVSSEMTFTVNVVSDVGVKSVSVMEGDTVTLLTGLTEIQRDGVIQWRFEQQKSPVAEINRKAGISNTYDVPDGRFRDRLQLDQTGSLTITHISATHAGLYEVEIISTSGYTIHKTFSVTVRVVSDVGVKSVSVLEGDSVTLLTDLTEIQRDGVIQWRFEQQKSPVAEINRKAGISNTSDGPDGRFRDRLRLDQTGSLTITDISATHAGRYEVDITSTSSRYTILHTLSFSVTVRVTDAGKSLSVKEGEPVTLQIDVTEIQNNELAVWMCGKIKLAEINKTEELYNTYGGPDERFKGRLELDYQTGSLTITNTRNTHSGDYDLKISSSRFTINRRITVSVTGSGLSTGEIVGIVAGVAGVAVLLVVAGLLVAARAGRVIPCRRLHRYLQHCIRRNINTTPSEIINFDENGQNDKQQDTDNPANEGTKLNDL